MIVQKLKTRNKKRINKTKLEKFTPKKIKRNKQLKIKGIHEICGKNYLMIIQKTEMKEQISNKQN